MTNWTNHVKAYAQAHNVSYKQAMTDSKDSYNKMSGGNFKNFERKVSNSLKTGERKVSNSLRTGERKTVNSLQKGNNIVRKLRNTTTRVIDEVSPLVSLALGPEIGLGLQGVKTAIGGKLGSKKNPYALKGGSFKTMSEGGSLSGKNICNHCGHMSGGQINNSMMTHPSFNNNNPRKSYSRALISN